MKFIRLKEYLTVLFVISIAAFSPIIILIIFILLSWFWSLPITLTLFLLYACWIYFDRHTASHEGRWSDRLRQLSIWINFNNYFPLKLIKTEDLDPKPNYIFGFHPHGFGSCGAGGNFGTDASNFSTLFPNIRPHVMILRFQFFFPFTREIFLNLGVRPVSRESYEYLLSGKCGQSHALVIVIGGMREQSLTQNNRMILYLKKRQGFVKLALEYAYRFILSKINICFYYLCVELHLCRLFHSEKMNYIDDIRVYHGVALYLDMFHFDDLSLLLVR